MKKINVSIATEVRIYVVNNKYYADPSFSKIIERYYNKFGTINLFTRVIKEEKLRNGYSDITSYLNKVFNIVSISKFYIKSFSDEERKCIENTNLFILRVPSIVSLKFYYKIIKKMKKKYLTEVMGCAWDAYWNHGLIGKIIAPLMYFLTKNIVKKANYSLYVTQKFLQKRYPNKNYNIGISNVHIKPSKIKRNYSELKNKKIVLFTAAAVDVHYKGQKYVIKAMHLLEKKGIDIIYYLAGKGNNEYLLKISKKYNLEKKVKFLGMLPKEDVMNQMYNSDIYIQPSLQEGLPRSLIEAMNCGCICLGSNIAGIPELLDNSMLFKKKHYKELAKKIQDIINFKSEELNKTSLKNSKKASNYASNILEKQRNNFYDCIIKDVNVR